LTEIDSNIGEETADFGETRIKNKRLKNERFIALLYLSLSDSYALAW